MLAFIPGYFTGKSQAERLLDWCQSSSPISWLQAWGPSALRHCNLAGQPQPQADLRRALGSIQGCQPSLQAPFKPSELWSKPTLQNRLFQLKLDQVTPLLLCSGSGKRQWTEKWQQGRKPQGCLSWKPREEELPQWGVINIWMRQHLLKQTPWLESQEQMSVQRVLDTTASPAAGWVRQWSTRGPPVFYSSRVLFLQQLRSPVTHPPKLSQWWQANVKPSPRKGARPPHEQKQGQALSCAFSTCSTLRPSTKGSHCILRENPFNKPNRNL